MDISPQGQGFPSEESFAVATFPTAEEAHQAGLVLLASGHGYWMQPVESGFLLVALAPENERERLLQQIERFLAEENNLQRELSWDDKGMHPQRGWLTGLLMILSWVVVYALGEPLLDAGRLDGFRVLEHGELFRLLTALFLHADAAHLLSNSILFFIVHATLASRIGMISSLFVFLVGGSFANFANIIGHLPENHLAIGASTGVFCLLGAVIPWLMSEPAPRGTFQSPIGRSIALAALAFALLGSGGPNVDVMGHFWGLLVGLLGGFISAFLPACRKIVLSPRFPLLPGVLILLLGLLFL